MRKTIITGATNGIGFETAKSIALKGHDLILVSRKLEKLENTKKLLKELNPKISIQTYACDFEDLVQVAKVATVIGRENPDLEILINNAGMWESAERKNEDGIEMTWVVNYYALVLFTTKLLPVLKAQADKDKASADLRIIILGSEGHRYANLDFNNLYYYHFQKTYGNTKLADMLYGFKLARDLNREYPSIKVNMVHPGVIATGLWAKLPGPIAWLLGRVLATPEKGAKTTIYLATQPELTDSGYYWAKSKHKEAKPIALDITTQDKLAEITNKVLKKYI